MRRCRDSRRTDAMSSLAFLNQAVGREPADYTNAENNNANRISSTLIKVQGARAAPTRDALEDTDGRRGIGRRRPGVRAGDVDLRFQRRSSGDEQSHVQRTLRIRPFARLGERLQGTGAMAGGPGAGDGIHELERGVRHLADELEHLLDPELSIPSSRKLLRAGHLVLTQSDSHGAIPGEDRCVHSDGSRRRTSWCPPPAAPP